MSKSNDHGYVNKITSWNGTERFLFFLQMYRMSNDVNKHVPNSEHVHFVGKKTDLFPVFATDIAFLLLKVCVCSDQLNSGVLVSYSSTFNRLSNLVSDIAVSRVERTV